MRTSGPVRPPRVLITVYGSRLQTLHRLLLSLLSSHFGPDAVGGENRGFVRDGDSADYVSFLEDSFSVLAENAPPIGAVSLRQRWSQQQVVERVIALQFRQEGNPAHVLCLGYRKVSCFPHLIQSLASSTSMEVVNSQSWVTLLSRVGDETMLHILSHSAIFVPLPNHCFLQVTGLPFTVTASCQKQIIQATLTSRIGWKGKKFQCQRIRNQSLNTGNDGCPEFAVYGVCQEDNKKAGKDSEEHLDCMSKKQCAKKKQLELNTVFLESPLTQTLSSQRKRKGSKTAECSSSGGETQVPKRIKLTGSDERIHFSRNKQTVDSVYVLRKTRAKEIAVGYKKPSVCPSSKIFRMKRENHLPESQDSGKLQKHVKKGGDLKTKEVGSAHGRIHELTAGFSSELLCCSKQIGSSECLQDDTKKLLRRMVCNARHCGYARLLHRHCPLPFQFWPSQAVQHGLAAEMPSMSKQQVLLPSLRCHDEAMVPELITCYTEHRQVVAFLWAVCRRLVPEEFLGSTRAWRSLCHSIACFVSLRRHETFYVQHILNKLQAKGFLWFNMRRCVPEKPTRNCRESHVAKQSEKGRQTSARERMTFGQMMLEDWLHWFFGSLIVPLIRAHFYVTESEHHRQNILYYRKPVWSKIQSLALRGLMSTSFTKLSPTSVAALLQKRAFGFSQIRLLPKHNGVRPIANLGNPSKSDLQQPSPKKKSSKTRKKHVRFYFKSINSVLKDTHLCLKYEQGCWPEDLGSSVFGYRDAYIKLLPFVMKMKATPGGVPPLYMAVCDISKAYDTIQQEKLCEVVQDFVRSPLYVVLRYASLFPTVGALRVAYERVCMCSDHPLNFLNFSMDVTAKHSHSIVHDQAVVTRMMQEQVVSLVKEHVKRNIVKVGSKYYQQKVGIPQGSVLSSLLCSLFYGHLDTHILFPLLQSSDTEISKGQSISDNTNSLAAAPDKNPEAGKPAASDCILLRFIDDSLFISTSENMVVKFVETMHKGFAEYGCHANRGKTAVSFDLELTDGQRKNVKNVYMSDDGACFMRWSGLLINCRTLEIQADYTRYCGEHIKGTLTVIRKRNPGAQVPHKLCHFMRAKCHPLLYDIRINSPSTIRLNAFQAFLLCAMKLHTYLQCLPRSAPHHPHFLFQAIVGSLRYMYGLLKQRMQATEANVHMALEVKEVEWLGLVAFLKMLQRKQSQYRILISLLQTRLHKSKYETMHSCPHLLSAVSDERSSMFKHIFY
ncbi:unnamed protein product [Sphagnum jensenii]|uniref:Telomerase reverse transcriptase n=1 Tax=Sphagnum jensenii TaxID=128206 RepID=A0ABP0VNL3_9BRYO